MERLLDSVGGCFRTIAGGLQEGASAEFSTGYVIELSLSVDNLFIFLLIFRYFRLPATEQYRVLFWGIIGAIAMRAAFIFAGVGLIAGFIGSSMALERC